MCELFIKSNGTVEHFDPNESIRKAVALFANRPALDGQSQECVSEFLSHVLGGLHHEMNRYRAPVAPAPAVEPEAPKADFPTSAEERDDSVISRTFGFSEIGVVGCWACGTRSRRSVFNANGPFNLPVNRQSVPISLAALVEQSFSVPVEVSYHCEGGGCCRSRTADGGDLPVDPGSADESSRLLPYERSCFKMTSIDAWPQVVVFNLKSDVSAAPPAAYFYPPKGGGAIY